jgi:hypothetical protein
MIPAKIIEISDKVLVKYYTGLEPVDKSTCSEGDKTISLMWSKYESSKVIAEVENAIKWSSFIGVNILENDIWTPRELELNQPCLIEPTTEGKCKIVKL